jgi:hypothetical protein
LGARFEKVPPRIAAMVLAPCYRGRALAERPPRRQTRKFAFRFRGITGACGHFPQGHSVDLAGRGGHSGPAIPRLSGGCARAGQIGRANGRSAKTWTERNLDRLARMRPKRLQPNRHR